MKIVVLDGYTLNPGDLSWSDLQKLGPCEIYDRLRDEELVSRAFEAEIVLTNKMIVSRNHMAQLPRLRYVGVTATGYNIVDVNAARERKIVVTNVPAYGTASVAQMTFALLLELTQRVGHHAQTVRDGRWARSPDFCYWDFPLVELDGLTLGILGFGRIGQAVGRMAQAFGMKVIATGRKKGGDAAPPGSARQRHEARPHPDQASDGCFAREPAAPQPQEREQLRDADCEFVSLEELLRKSDVVSLHCPLTPETKHVINAERLARMKPTAFLLNTSRGPLIDEAALAEALKRGQIAGAGLDVLSQEPPPADHPLYSTPNCFITPHIAWATRAARARLMRIGVENVAAFINGKPQNVVS
jgi:glycerate dehydrogenase